MDHETLSPILDIETIAKGNGIRELARLREEYGDAKWRKLKGTCLVRTPAGHTRLAEVHWYQGHGVGKVELKVKQYLD